MANQREYREQALQQIEALRRLAHSAHSPVRPGEPESGLILGLGIVGLWAAVDAFLERVGYGGRTLPERLSERVSPELVEASKELEDVRHLYAQNFGGFADELYLSSRRRYNLRNRSPRVLASGATFSGRSLQMDASQFRWYISLSLSIVEEVRL